MHRRSSLLLLSLILMIPSLANASATPSLDWPQFRGPSRDGTSPETRLLTHWPKAGPQVVWRSQGGKGYSGLVVSEGRVYTLIGEGFGDFGSEYVVSLDAATGKELWRFHSGALWVDPSGNGDGPRATPTTDESRLYAVSGDGKLYALDKQTGKAVWQRDLKADFGSTGASDGSFIASPLVEGELLLVEVGGNAEKPGKSAYVAFDRKTGEVRWTAENDGAGFSAPIAITAAGQRQIVFFSATGLVSLSPENGKVYWRYPWTTRFDINAAMPVLLPNDRLFISSGYDVGAAVLQMKPDKGGVAVEEVWKSRVMKNHFASSVLRDGHLYGFDQSTLKCIEATTGKERWKGRGYGTGNLIYADGHLIVLADKGELALVQATPNDFKEVARAQILEGRTITSPTLAEGRLYVRNNTGEIVCLKLTEGA